jgi:hypothetical protein
MEDVEFKPFETFSDIFESLASFPLADHHFVLGYFAAIIINGENIELDLNGFELKQSPLHNLQQRFFALIEMADRPFLPGQGPAHFGTTLTSCKNIKIHNGILGLSSHYGIHGNNMENVALRDLTIYNYEVAGISLNGGVNLSIENVNVQHNYHHIKVTGLFSNAIFTAKKLLVKQRENPYLSVTVHGQSVSITDILIRLVASINDAYTDIQNGQPIGTVNRDSKLYDNSVNGFLLDGNCYGIALNTTGLLVNEFKQNYEGKNRNITLRNVVISDIKSKPVERLGLCEIPLDELGLNPQTSPTLNKGAFGDVPLFFDCVDDQGRFTHDYNPLILAQVLGAIKISDSIMTWINTGSSDFYKRVSQLTVLNNLDIMAHVFKGTNGLFISSGNTISCSNMVIKNIYNYSQPGKEEFVLRDHEYVGSRVTGVTIASSDNIRLNSITIDQLYSEIGQACGFYYYGKCGSITRTNCSVQSLVTNVNHDLTSKTPRTKTGVAVLMDATF